MLRLSRMVGTALVIFVVVAPCLEAQDEKVFRSLTPEATEKLLENLKFEVKKSSSKKGDLHYYDFQRNNFRVRLTYFSAQELMLDCVFRGLPIEKVNQWNSSTKVTRASLQKDSTGDFTLLEYGLDLAGGVTEGTIKQYVLRFEEELKKYETFLGSNPGEDPLLTKVGDDKIESVLKTIGVTYQKKMNPAGVMMFDFEMHKHKLRLYNFGGKDLMMDSHFRKIPLDAVNRYNLNKKFIRVVNYKGKDYEYTSVEVNFDCEAGVTEGMLRHWILNYADDVLYFAAYTKNLKDEEKK